ncbi:MAG: 3-hydroxyacyl-CoA dehydrogenase NAD-binding domain-containing protein [Pseudomonadota bacterium]
MTGTPDVFEPVAVEIAGRWAFVTITCAPGEGLVGVHRAALAELVETFDGDAGLDAAVLFLGSRASGVLDGIGGAPTTQAVNAAIEAAKTPWCAVISDATAPGELELSLGCAYRMALPGATLGLPDVALGLTPAGGATVRLPPLVGATRALAMITTGKPVTTKIAFDAGLLHAVVANWETEGVAVLSALLLDPRPIPASTPGLPDDWDATLAAATAKARGGAAIPRAAELLTAALTGPAEAAFAAEAAARAELAARPEAAALAHLYRAEATAPNLPGLSGVAPRPVNHVGVVGGGTMGAGIAAACLLAGLPVTLLEQGPDALAAGLDRVSRTLDASAKRGVVSAARRAELAAMVTGTTDYGDFAPCDLVIEAVYEDIGVKKEVFAALDRICRPEAVLATNTSYLDVNVIAASVGDPARVLGLHFFSPAHVMRLLEIVRPATVAGDVLATGFAFGARLGKICVPAGVCDGFIGNRVLTAYRRECDYMIEDGAWPQEVDAAMVAYGFPMGIFAMQDMAGLDIGWAARKRRAPTRDPAERYVHISDRICEMGRFGQKTGAGWYTYPEGSRRGEPDAIVEELIVRERVRAGVTPREFTVDEIMDRILGAMTCEGRAILAEGIAASAGAIDVVMANGYGFPRHRGGPMFAAGVH